jgi:hypothetical protein
MRVRRVAQGAHTDGVEEEALPGPRNAKRTLSVEMRKSTFCDCNWWRVVADVKILEQICCKYVRSYRKVHAMTDEAVAMNYARADLATTSSDTMPQVEAPSNTDLQQTDANDGI